jgi:two-component system, NtrC family, sensor kinase
MSLFGRVASTIRNAPIRRKLALIIAVTCGAGILVAGGAVFAFQTFTLRSTFQRDIAALTAIVADNLSGPVAFGDRKAALEVLGSLRAKPQIASAIVRTRSGQIFAMIGKSPDGTENAAPAPGAMFDGWTLHVGARIPGDAENSGTLSLTADFRGTFLSSLGLFALALAGISIGALGIALGIGRNLQRLITEPVLRLSDAACEIGEKRDFGVRVDKLGNDELGVLTDAFNGMLERVHAADAELRSANGALTSEIEQRRRLQNELVEASRLAGMAEVATGVLHNVGNVLNSVNVSAGLMLSQIKTSRLPTLRRTAELLRSHEHDLAAFFTTDEKGRRIPGFMERLAEQLALEQKRFSDELIGVTRNIDHIKEIVAMQQTYAKASAVIEQVDLQQLLDQAISINRARIERHGVQVQRDFPPALPAVATDRHKILQVLTNFVANAVQAVKVNPMDGRRMTVSIRQDNTSELELSVSDNGEGIPPENLGKIFRQGFTTRKDGHGFGLHSGVLIVKSLGGTLEAASAGPRQGATFTLRLPLKPTPALAA